MKKLIFVSRIICFFILSLGFINCDNGSTDKKEILFVSSEMNFTEISKFGKVLNVDSNNQNVLKVWLNDEDGTIRLESVSPGEAQVVVTGSSHDGIIYVTVEANGNVQVNDLIMDDSFRSQELNFADTSQFGTIIMLGSDNQEVLQIWLRGTKANIIQMISYSPGQAKVTVTSLSYGGSIYVTVEENGNIIIDQVIINTP